MKKLLFLAIIAFAAWYGWNHRDTILRGNDSSEAVVVNAGTRAMTRVRLTVGGKTQVRDDIEPADKATFVFRLSRPSDFQLNWDWRGLEIVPSWRGGEALAAPLRQRCTLQVFDDGTVTCTCAPLVGSPGGS